MIVAGMTIIAAAAVVTKPIGAMPVLLKNLNYNSDTECIRDDIVTTTGIHSEKIKIA